MYKKDMSFLDESKKDPSFLYMSFSDMSYFCSVIDPKIQNIYIHLFNEKLKQKCILAVFFNFSKNMLKLENLNFPNFEFNLRFALFLKESQIDSRTQ